MNRPAPNSGKFKLYPCRGVWHCAYVAWSFKVTTPFEFFTPKCVRTMCVCFECVCISVCVWQSVVVSWLTEWVPVRTNKYAYTFELFMRFKMENVTLSQHRAWPKETPPLTYLRKFILFHVERLLQHTHATAMCTQALASWPLRIEAYMIICVHAGACWYFRLTWWESLPPPHTHTTRRGGMVWRHTCRCVC